MCCGQTFGDSKNRCHNFWFWLKLLAGSKHVAGLIAITKLGVLVRTDLRVPLKSNETHSTLRRFPEIFAYTPASSRPSKSGFVGSMQHWSQLYSSSHTEYHGNKYLETASKRQPRGCANNRCLAVFERFDRLLEFGQKAINTRPVLCINKA